MSLSYYYNINKKKESSINKERHTKGGREREREQKKNETDIY